MNKDRRVAWQWDPPKRQMTSEDLMPPMKDVQSATECTGLMPHVPEDESEAHALAQLYAIHPAKPKGNIGKDNPNNSEAEVHFHRQ